MELSKAQRLAKKLSSDEKFERMKAESQQWKFKCDCGKEPSIWDIGGIRYKARGNPKKRLKCPHCGQTSMHKIYKAE